MINGLEKIDIRVHIIFMGRTLFNGGPNKADADGLTYRERKFVDFYDGNASEASRKAGYAPGVGAGSKLMHKPHIVRAIQNKTHSSLQRELRTKEARMRAVGAIALDIAVKHADRLKAMEMIMKATGDFLSQSITVTSESDEGKVIKISPIPSDDDVEQTLEEMMKLSSVAVKKEVMAS